ncbi:hypothetical protein [Photobacterium lucens]|uniref:hypothetical protein n=1 Tax=Photobacterium lucens TaxID=2562949 RepID=UPI00136824C2|nr:hypothetical protein [Photobacterium lucens]MBP2700718.1 hypothetical protein [Vibrio parahaemolyticus]MZG58123.1 hypothetical protein [Photobacterium lucens]MZG82724.1 hypothetical protein [Photobacterium lucens]
MLVITEKLITLKNAWMASHITDAEFPTPLSEKGLNLYQLSQTELTAHVVDTPVTSSDPSLSFYPVDCHPLTIRYSLVRASQWQNDDEKEAIVEYLTQIMFEPDAEATLYVGLFKGKPAACGMIFNHSEEGEHHCLVSDIYALPLPNQDQLMEEIENYLVHTAQQTSQSVTLQK